MLLDSNVLVYAINAASPKNQKAQAFIQAHIRSLKVAHQNIFESLRILTHTKFPSPMTAAEASAAIEQIIGNCTIIAPDYKTHRIALELITKYALTSDQVFDAYLVATALSNSITTIATDNVRDFERIAEIRVLNPFA